MAKSSTPPAPPVHDFVLWADPDGNLFEPTLEGMKPNGKKLSEFEFPHEIKEGPTINGLTQFTICPTKSTDASR